MASVNDFPVTKEVYDTVEKHFPMEVGTGYLYDESGQATGIDLVDIDNIEDEGGTAQDICELVKKARQAEALQGNPDNGRDPRAGDAGSVASLSPPSAAAQIIDVDDCRKQLKLLVNMSLICTSLICTSTSFSHLRRLKEPRYWVPMDRGNPLAVDEDPSQCSQGPPAKQLKRPRGRPRGKQTPFHFSVLCAVSVPHLC